MLTLVCVVLIVFFYCNTHAYISHVSSRRNVVPSLHRASIRQQTSALHYWGNSYSLDSSLIPRPNWVVVQIQTISRIVATIVKKYYLQVILLLLGIALLILSVCFSYLLLAIVYRAARVLHQINVLEKIKKKLSQVYKIFIEEFDDSVFIEKLLSIQDIITNEYFPSIRESAKITYANSLVFLERIQRIATKIVDLNPAEEIDIDEWKVCSLLDREDISPKYSKYRFELLNPDGVLPLNIGQELTMCVIDDKDRVLKESFFPVSTQNSKGYFDVVVQNENDYAGNINENSFASTLKELSAGDELAFKGGKYRLNYNGKQKKISALTCLAAGVGITPILQVLRGVLPESESSINDVELLWMNENGDEFLCVDEVSKFEIKYYSKFFASKVVQPDLYGVNMLKNDDILGAISPYEPGRIAVVAGPDYVITKARQLLTTIGYPSDCILSILQ